VLKGLDERAATYVNRHLATSIQDPEIRPGLCSGGFPGDDLEAAGQLPFHIK
jgi:hypothetical protein